jgi:hypothetical protein
MGVVAAVLCLPLWISTPAVADDATFLGRTPDQWFARLESTKAVERAEAAWAIAQIADRYPYYVGSGLAKSADPTVQYWHVQALQRIVQSKVTRAEVRDTARQVLQDGLATEVPPAIRITAAESLGLLGDTDRALPVLMEAMSHPQEAVRIQAVSALEKLGESARPAGSTLRAATTDSSEYVKRISARALQKLDSKK